MLLENKYLTTILKKTMKVSKKKKHQPNWRVDNKYFAAKKCNQKLVRGVKTFSASWYAQGHNVCVLFFHLLISLISAQDLTFANDNDNINNCNNNRDRIINLLHHAA